MPRTIYSSTNERYIIRPDETGFLQLSRIDPTHEVDTTKNEKSSEDLSVNWCNGNNELLLDGSNDVLPSTSIPTYNSLNQNSKFFANSTDLLMQSDQFDVVIIPSGGMDDGGTPFSPVLARLDAAAQLNHHTEYFLSSGAYTPLKPVLLNCTGQPITEARSDAVYLFEQHEIPQNKLILEEMSKDTLGNAYFSRILCTLMHFEKIVVVTSKFHMLRARALFDWVFGLIPRVNSNLYYLETLDFGMSENEVIARQKKEAQSLRYFWQHTKQKLSSMKDLTQFIYLGHRAYAFNNEVGCYDVTAPLEAFKFY